VAARRDRVEVRITTKVRIRARWVDGQLEVGFGKASPVVLVVERDAFYDLADAINNQEPYMPAQTRNLEG